MSPQHDCFPVPKALFCQRNLPCDARNVMFACTLADAGKLSSGLSMHGKLSLASGIQLPIRLTDSNPDSGRPRLGFNSGTISQPQFGRKSCQLQIRAAIDSKSIREIRTRADSGNLGTQPNQAGHLQIGSVANSD